MTTEKNKNSVNKICSALFLNQVEPHSFQREKYAWTIELIYQIVMF